MTCLWALFYLSRQLWHNSRTDNPSFIQGFALIMLNVFCLILTLMLPVHAHAITPPAADAVFKLHARTQDANTFVLEWNMKPGYFLYKDRMKLMTHETNDPLVSLAPLTLPTGTQKTDSQGHTFSIYRNKLIVPVSVLGQASGETVLDVRAQGCSDDGFCYPPKNTPIKLTFDATHALTQATVLSDEPMPTHTTPSAPLEAWGDTFSHHWAVTLVIFLSLGLLLSLTPCVLPMIPVLSGIIVGRGPQLSTRQAFLLSLSYVLSMSITYACVGAMVALMGQNLQLLMQSPWVITLFSLLFVLLALAMFNVYELRLPLSWQAALARLSYNQARGHYAGAAIMGCLSTLILSPCVTAPLIGALSYIASTGNVLLGVSALFMLGLGMGLPLLLIGTSLGKFLPHAGRWMNGVKIFFGVLLLAVAVDLMSRVVPSFHQEAPNAAITVITTSDKLEEARARAKQEGKPLLVDFYADWCRSCKIMEHAFQQDERIQAALQSFIVIKADITAHDNASLTLMNCWHVVAPPTFLVFDASGDYLHPHRMVGEVTPDAFLKTLEAARQP